MTTSPRTSVTPSQNGKSPSDARSSLDALRRILEVWRPFYRRLGFGLLLSALALLSGLALMWNAGLGVSALAVGTTLAYGLLRFFGGARIILRYTERLYAHDAMFRALAALRVWFSAIWRGGRRQPRLQAGGRSDEPARRRYRASG